MGWPFCLGFTEGLAKSGPEVPCGTEMQGLDVIFKDGDHHSVFVFVLKVNLLNVKAQTQIHIIILPA